MKRFLIFLLLGPLIGFTVFDLREFAAGRLIDGFPGYITGLPFAYWFGLVPSLMMWLEDWFLEDKMGLWPKVLTSAIIGAAIAIGMLTIWTSASLHAQQFVTFGLVGSVQGAACSWLSGIKTRNSAG